MAATRLTPTAQHKQRASSHIRQLARDVKQTFPDMDVDQHLTDAAREIDAGRHDNARHHLDAAINAFAPLHLIRHGIHDDEGHRAAKSFMQRAHRGRLLAADVENISGQNEQLMHTRKEAAMADAERRAAARTLQTPAAAVPAVPVPAARQMSWDAMCDVIELATFAGARPGSGRNFAKLSSTLASRGAKNPGALAAYIGRKKYGRKGFARLGRGSSHANQAGGIELVGPKGYIHGWIHASMATLSKSGGGAYLPDHPGFGTRTPNTLTRAQHRTAAAGHLHMMKQAPAGSDKARLHHKFAKLHAAASEGMRSGAAIAGAPRTGLFAADQDGIELVGPKGYVHGWRYVGGPGLPSSPPARERASRARSHISAARSSGRDMHRHMETAREHASAGGFSHLPPDIAKALNDYDANVRSGVIAFAGGSKFATNYPGHAASDAALGRFVASKVAQFGWDDLDGIIALSADTGRLASQHHPLGRPGGPGLWGVKGMELPPYIQNIARALLRKGRAKNLSQAIAMAKGATARWAAGKNTRPEVRAAAAATNASWAAKQARAPAQAGPAPGIELAFRFNPLEKRDSTGRWTAPGSIADELHNTYKNELNPKAAVLARKAEASLRANDLGAARRHLLDLSEYHRDNLAALDKAGYRRNYRESKHLTHKLYGGFATQAREMAESIGEGHPDGERISQMQHDLDLPPAPMPSDAELEAQMGLNDTKTLAEMTDDELAAELARRRKAKALSFTTAAPQAARL
jgi:hypothetical protein